ncbi:DUF5132 domain-containing protein [Lyngbya aestuarii]|uniref:DUF5132 domain-containing protein n=1 Tax=Lyngbya aestuarii TaxID=118322 RepID=UPI00403D9744
MAVLEDLFEGVTENMGVPGIAAGLGAVVLAPLLIPAVAKVGKPFAKAAIKGGIVLFEKGKGLVEETGELFEDLVAESKAELAEKRVQAELEGLQPHAEAN